jgi:hypothetical protein
VEEELAKLDQRLQGEITSPVQIITAWPVRRHQQSFIAAHIAGQPARY